MSFSFVKGLQGKNQEYICIIKLELHPQAGGFFEYFSN